jgi:toxin CcdB
MARFEVFANPGGAGYVLDVQADVLSELNTRIVAPLLPLTQAPVPADRLNPVFEIGDAPHVMVTQFMAAVRPKAAVGARCREGPFRALCGRCVLYQRPGRIPAAHEPHRLKGKPADRSEQERQR